MINAQMRAEERGSSAGIEKKVKQRRQQWGRRQEKTDRNTHEYLSVDRSGNIRKRLPQWGRESCAVTERGHEKKTLVRCRSALNQANRCEGRQGKGLNQTWGHRGKKTHGGEKKERASEKKGAATRVETT